MKLQKIWFIFIIYSLVLTLIYTFAVMFTCDMLLWIGFILALPYIFIIDGLRRELDNVWPL